MSPTDVTNNFMELEKAIEIIMSLAANALTTAEDRVAFNVVHDFIVNNIFGDEYNFLD